MRTLEVAEYLPWAAASLMEIAGIDPGFVDPADELAFFEQANRDDRALLLRRDLESLGALCTTHWLRYGGQTEESCIAVVSSMDVSIVAMSYISIYVASLSVANRRLVGRRVLQTTQTAIDLTSRVSAQRYAGQVSAVMGRSSEGRQEHIAEHAESYRRLVPLMNSRQKLYIVGQLDKTTPLVANPHLVSP